MSTGFNSGVAIITLKRRSRCYFQLTRGGGFGISLDLQLHSMHAKRSQKYTCSLPVQPVLVAQVAGESLDIDINISHGNFIFMSILLRSCP